MKLELRENMYIRTKYGIIDKILKLNKSYVKGVSQKDELYAYDIDNIVKASYNIIDILEEGDYVNGKKVIDTFTDYIFDYSEEFKVIRFSETDGELKLKIKLYLPLIIQMKFTLTIFITN